MEVLGVWGETSEHRGLLGQLRAPLFIVCEKPLNLTEVSSSTLESCADPRRMRQRIVSFHGARAPSDLPDVVLLLGGTNDLSQAGFASAVQVVLSLWCANAGARGSHDFNPEGLHLTGFCPEAPQC